MFLLPCAFHIILLVFLLSPLSGLEVLQDEGVRLSAPLGQGAQELREKRDGDDEMMSRHAKTSCSPRTLEEIRAFSSSTLVHTAG